MLTIPISPETSIPRKSIEVGRASAFRARLVGIPADFDNVQIHFGRPDTGDANAVACTPVPGGEWNAYAGGAYFPAVGKAQYHVTARTPQGDSAYLGSGTLRVVPSVLNVGAEEALVVPQDLYAHSPKNGLYYKVTAELDEDGVPFLIVDRNGVTK